MGAVYIGTSGWQYDDWEGLFYTKNLSDNEKLKYYSEHFSTVEVNNTFYNLPRNEIAEEWADDVSENFVISIKANRYITHMKNLKDPEEPVNNLLDFLDHLKGKNGPILFQLSGNWHINYERLGKFIKVLPEDYRYAFEFRHKSWYEDKVFDLLEGSNIALVLHDMNGSEPPMKVTADFIYIRFHGLGGKKYQWFYKDDELKPWADKINQWKKEKDIYAYFNNDYQGNAIKNATTLISLVS